ncbi:MAG: hypothetical protein ACLQF4_01615 [Xanthobacteraceae bacterium]
MQRDERSDQVIRRVVDLLAVELTDLETRATETRSLIAQLSARAGSTRPGSTATKSPPGGDLTTATKPRSVTAPGDGSSATKSHPPSATKEHREVSRLRGGNGRVPDNTKRSRAATPPAAAARPAKAKPSPPRTAVSAWRQDADGGLVRTIGTVEAGDAAAAHAGAT